MTGERSKPITYMPTWMKKLFPEEGTITREKIFSTAEELYGIMPIESRKLLADYLEDLVEENVISYHGNSLCQGENFSLATSE